MSKFKIGDKEVWRKIGRWPYSVSDLGNIRSDKTGKILKGGISGGYRSVVLCSKENNKKQRLLVRHHHMVMRWFIGERPLGFVINHKNCNKLDNKLSNLEYCTPQENRHHAIKNRLYNYGEQCSWAKLNAESVLLIRKAYEIGLSLNQLARAFNVHKKSILDIVSKKTWKSSAEHAKKYNYEKSVNTDDYAESAKKINPEAQ